jgi:pyruvate-formate lyase-activating enzyme
MKNYLPYIKKLNFTIDQNETRPLIYYGASHFIEKTFYKLQIPPPILFADADSGKHGTKLLGVEIVSLQDAMSRYCDALIVITNAEKNLIKIADFLIKQGVAVERIKYCKPAIWRLGCEQLGRTFYLRDGNIRTCVDSGNPRTIVSAENLMPTIFQEYKKYTNALISNLCKDIEIEPCSHCMRAEYGYYVTSPEINTINISSSFPGDLCNFECKDCGHNDALKLCDYSNAVYKNPVEFLEAFLCYAGKDNYVNRLYLANGEPTLSSRFNDLLTVIKQQGWYLNLLTNASIFKSGVFELMKLGKCGLEIDLSAGTCKTFEKVKGVSEKYWNIVINNIKQYASDVNSKITLKYILFEGFNDNYEDMKSFIDICKLVRAKAKLSNNYKSHMKFSAENIRFLKLFVDSLKGNNIPITFSVGNISKEGRQLLLSEHH